MTASGIEIYIRKSTPGLWWYLLGLLGLFAAASFMLARGSPTWLALVAWAGIVVFGGGAILVARKIIAPEIVARLTAQGVEDAFGLIRWSDVGDAGLCATRGHESLWLTLPCDRYPGRGHPKDQAGPDIVVWQANLRRNRRDLDAIRDLVEERLGRNSTHAAAPSTR
jgi:hypothetical protein